VLPPSPAWEADECLHMIERIVAAHPRARTIIFQDDIFSFTRDRRILPLCEGIIAASARGTHSESTAIHQHESDRCHDSGASVRNAGAPAFAYSASASRASRSACSVNSTRHRSTATSSRCSPPRSLPGVTPFLDLILSSPHAQLEDVAETLRQAYRWLREGCEIGDVSLRHSLFGSGPAFARDPSLAPYTHHVRRQVAGHRNFVAATGQDSADGSCCYGRHPANGEQLRGDARTSGEGGGASDLTRAARSCGSCARCRSWRSAAISSLLKMKFEPSGTPGFRRSGRRRRDSQPADA